MAYITLDIAKLKYNYEFIDKLFKKNNIEWSVVTKLLCGNKEFLQALLDLGVRQASDSRVTNLRILKNLNKEIETIYIKPPAKSNIISVVKYADISMNTEVRTIELLSAEAKKQGKTHKIIIMVELGELREGVIGEKLLSFYKKFRLSTISKLSELVLICPAYTAYCLIKTNWTS